MNRTNFMMICRTLRRRAPHILAKDQHDSRASVSAVESKSSIMVFWAAAFLLFFWALGDRGLWGSEGRWAEIVREMFLTGDFFHPTINGEPYFDKPLLTYWLIALVSAVTGRLDEWIVRLPSAISGLLALWATVYLGQKLWSKQVGRTAGWIVLTSYGILFWARTGSADMENLAVITMAVAWYWARRERPNFCTYLVFYLICFLGANCKGLTAVAVPILGVIPDILRERRWRALLSVSHLLALSIGMVAYLAPFIWATMTREGYQASGLGLVFRENILRYFQPFDHKESFYVYLYYVPELFLPWTPLFLTALWGAFASLKRLDRKTRWLAKAMAVIFLFFSVSGSRRNYYILPILPFCALFASVFLNTEGKKGRKRLGFRLQAGLFALISVIEILSPAIWPILKERLGFVPPGDFMLAAQVLGLLALVPLALGYLRPGLLANFTGTSENAAPLVVAATIVMGGFFCWQQGNLEAYRSERPFAMELKAQVAGVSPKDIAFYHKVSTNSLFYLDLPEPIGVLKDSDAVQSFVESGKGNKVLVSTRKDYESLLPALPAGLGGQPTLSEKVYPWERKSKKKLMAREIKGNEE